MHNYPGNIHVHSRYSDGSADFGQIIAAAAAAGLSYVIINDHETLAGLSEETISQGVVLLVGAELNSLRNHYLAFGIDHLILSDNDNPQNVIDRVREAGGLGFIAHPFDRGSRYIEKGKAYPWVDWPVFGFNGIELWNFSSHWRGLHPSLFRTLYWFFINRKGAMKGPPRRLLRLWDCYNINNGRVVAIGGSDAHAYLYRLGFFRLTIFTYRYTFSAINTYLVLNNELSSEFSAAKKEILGALREGNCYLAFDSLYPGKEFFYYAVSGEKKVLMGGELCYRENIIVKVKSPARRALIKLIIDGEVIIEKEGSELEFKVAKPGCYRVEVYYRPRFGRPRPWIYANPIYIR